MRISRILAVAALIAAPSFARAQAPSDSTARSELIKMKSDLRNLVVAQEAYFADNGAYAAAMDGLRYRTSTGVSVRLTVTTNKAWAAESMNEKLPNTRCIIYVNLDGDQRPKLKGGFVPGEGEPACENTTANP